jgi:Holliday junction resolvase YEN1
MVSAANGALSHPVEKGIFYRTMRLLRQNVELLFVFDGPKRPQKRGRRGGSRVDWDRIRLLHQLLQRLQVPYHMAPGEAEAECARLQQEGVVDAVWSDDSDTLMFGCDFLIKAHYEKGPKANSKSHTHVKVIRPADICQKQGLSNMDKDGILLFALIAGGDYDTDGLPGCGPGKALTAVKKGFGRRLAQIRPGSNDHVLLQWRDDLGTALNVSIPESFPNARAWNYYRNPSVSTVVDVYDRIEERILRLEKVDEKDLRVFLGESFNINLQLYMKHVSPVFLVRALRQQQSDGSGDKFGIEVVVPRSSKKTESTESQIVDLEKNIRYSPHALALLNAGGQLEAADWPEDFHITIAEASIPTHVLDYGAPATLRLAEEKTSAKLDKTSSKKRAMLDQDDGESAARKKSRQTKKTKNAETGSSNISKTKGKTREIQEPSVIFVSSKNTGTPTSSPLKGQSSQDASKKKPDGQPFLVPMALSSTQKVRKVFRLPKTVNIPLVQQKPVSVAQHNVHGSVRSPIDLTDD